jgi:hypothetical protein
MRPYSEASSGVAALKIHLLLLRLTVHYHVHKSLQLDAFLSHIEAVSTLKPYFLKNRFKIIFNQVISQLQISLTVKVKLSL